MADGEIMREEYHKKHIEYIGIGITQVSYWRTLLFQNDYGKKFLISQKSIDTMPVDLQEFFLKYDLRFYISKVTELECPEDFDGLVIFKFESVEFPSITWYSGNNSDVI